MQYLYAALSLKKNLAEGLDTRQQKLVRDWEMTILLIAREEMGHLAIVCNLLAAIGAPAKFDRPPMPRKVDYYPFPFDLVPFSDEALYRFLVFELPRDTPLPPPPNADLSPVLERAFAHRPPQPIRFKYIGELYQMIADGFLSIPEERLFLGPEEAQTDREWSDPSLDIVEVKDRVTAIAAIKNIIEDGEGTPADRANSHYHRFERIRQTYFDEGRFDAARKVPTNPATIEDSRASGPVVLIRNDTSLAVATLFNSTYGLMLLLLQMYFSMAPTENASRSIRQQLRLTSQRLMSVALRPIAEELTLLPLDAERARERAAPPFEIYSAIVAPPYATAGWKVIFEQFDSIIADSSALAQSVPRLGPIGETLAFMKVDLMAVTMESA